MQQAISPPQELADIAPNILTALATGISNISGTHVTSGQLENHQPLIDGIDDFLQNRGNGNSGRPKAFLNWILIDERFNYVASSSGFDQVNTTDPDYVTNHVFMNLPIDKNGYLYVFVSNENTEPKIVYFDNLQVTHIRGPLVEENQFYPFGLQQSGISSKALNYGNPENKHRYNSGSELQNKEFSDGGGLEMFATPLRNLDPQIGRWWQLDPKPDYAQSLYSAMNNNPIFFNDALGDTAIF